MSSHFQIGAHILSPETIRILYFTKEPSKCGCDSYRLARILFYVNLKYRPKYGKKKLYGPPPPPPNNLFVLSDV